VIHLDVDCEGIQLVSYIGKDVMHALHGLGVIKLG
jgi:hypothetical protein